MELMKTVMELIGLEDINRIDLGIVELLAIEAIVESPDGWLAFWDVDKDESYIAEKIRIMCH